MSPTVTLSLLNAFVGVPDVEGSSYPRFTCITSGASILSSVYNQTNIPKGLSSICIDRRVLDPLAQSTSAVEALPQR